MKNHLLTSLLFLFLFQQAAFSADNATNVFAKGGDVSWLPEMEKESNFQFYNDNGVAQDCFQILKDHGINTIRLRTWVNPSMTDWKNGHCSTAETVAMAVRAQSWGMRVMIDFHYSDTWADPGHQTKPSAWAALTFTGLKAALVTHTKDVLTTLKTNGITPNWVQVGNETGNGMLWEDGKASTNMANYAALTTAGYDAVKSVFPDTKVIVHIQSGQDNSLFRWLFDGLKSNGGKWDVIGMSLYPSTSDWQVQNGQCLSNMNDMVARYGKEVMICEVGMNWNSAGIAKSFLTDLIAKTKSVSGGKGLGVFYWEPESYGNWNQYSLGAFDNNGKPTIAMDAFK